MTTQLSIQQKKERNPYKVTGTGKSVDLDSKKNIATGLFNSYFYIDSDLDMLLPGAAKKSIQERGPGTKTGNKIKHLKQHSWNDVVARIDVAEEKTVTYDGKQITGIYHESYYDPKIEDSIDMLAKIESGYYDSRSIGYQYMDITLAERDSVEQLYRENWNKYYPMAINPEKADATGYFYVVKEIKWYEGSDVSMAANQLTPFLGMKSGDTKSLFETLHKKLGIINSILHKGSITDKGGFDLEMEVLQIKQALFEIEQAEPSIKDTLHNSRKSTGENVQKGSAIEFFKYL